MTVSASDILEAPALALPPLTLPRAVLFDWDNTLITNWRCVHAATNAALEAFGMPAWTLEESYTRVRQSLRDAFPVLFGDGWERARDIFYAHFETHHLDYLDPLAGAGQLLEALSVRGVYVGVVSNKTGRFLRTEARALGWDRWCGALVGAGDAEADKPHPAPVHLALQPAGLAPGPDVWFVGDADVDMEVAHRTGCVPLMVGATPHGEGTLSIYPPHRRFAGCDELCTLVDGL